MKAVMKTMMRLLWIMCIIGIMGTLLGYPQALFLIMPLALVKAQENKKK